MHLTSDFLAQGYTQLPDGTWVRPRPPRTPAHELAAWRRAPRMEFSVATVGGAALATIVPHGGLDLDSDEPLPGGAACPLDGSCEACQ